MNDQLTPTQLDALLGPAPKTQGVQKLDPKHTPAAMSASGSILSHIVNFGKDTVKSAGSSLLHAGDEFKSAMNRGSAAHDDPLHKTQTGVQEVGALAGGALGVMTAPITAAAGETVEGLSNSPTVAKIADKVAPGLDKANAASAKIEEFKKKHPDVSADLDSILNIVGLAGGVEGAVRAPGAVKGAAESMANRVKGVLDKRNIPEAVPKTMDPVAAKKLKPIVESLQPRMTPTQVEEAANAGRTTSKGPLGRVTVEPTARDFEVGHEVSSVPGYKPNNTKAANIKAIRNEISANSGILEGYLNDHSVPSNFEDFRGYIENNVKPPKNLQTAGRDAQTAYTDARENLTNTVAEHLKSMGKFESDTSMADYWKARQAVDDAIEEELGSKTFDTPQYKGAKAAANDFRNAMNGFVKDSLKNPGQMEKLNKIDDFISESASRGIRYDTVDNLREALKKEFGVSTFPEDEVKAAFFSNTLDRMSKLYEAKGNLATWSRGEVGKNKIGRFIKAHPVQSTIIGLGAEQAGVAGVKHLLGE